MNLLWNCINRISLNDQLKITTFLFCSTVLAALMGFSIWWCIHFFVLNRMDWMICFMGYPALFAGFLGGVFYLWKLY